MADAWDVQGFDDQLANELEKLERHHQDDIDHVKRFVRRRDGQVADSTLAQYLKELRKTSERLGDETSLVGLSKRAFETHVYALRHEYELADGTIRNVEFAVRKFLSDIEDGPAWPDDYDLTPPPENTVTPDDMLTSEDIAALTDGAANLRDVALIEFLADTGARLSLVGSLRVGDVELDGQRATYTPNAEANGLKGATIQPYPIIDSKAVLRSYLRTTHPRPDRDDVALFHKVPGHGNDHTADRGALSSTSIRMALRRAADSAGVDKPVNPHNFRHSAITRMVREGYSRDEIEHRVQWTVDTDMWATYQHIAGDEHNDAIFAKAGLGDDSDTPDHVRRPCRNCSEPIAPHHHYCPQCGVDLSEQAARMRESATDSLATGMAQIDDMSRREFRAMVLKHLQADPSDLGVHDSPPSSSIDSSKR